MKDAVKELKKLVVVSAALGLMSLLFAANAAAQVNSAIGGIVQDGSSALIPGVSVTAINMGTGVESKGLTNESGTYNFAALPPGTYNVKAELPGFRTKVVTGVELSAASPSRVNFTMEPASLSTTVEVSVAADSVLAASGASIGEVLTSSRVTDLPIVGNDVMDLVRIMPGFRESAAGAAFDTFAGTNASTVNTTRDGISVTDGRFANGVFSTTTINPDLVGEVRLILTPVDAELGRGNAQVQVQTRSGTNRFTGTAAWYVRNTALNPNTWDNNRTGTAPNWMNNHEYSISIGGPIIRNKTFFYALWDQQIHRERTAAYGAVLTNTARQGIFRWYDGWNPTTFDRAATPTIATAATRVMPATDINGNPVSPPFNADGTPYSGAGLQCISVFGNMKLGTNGAMTPFTNADCPGGTALLNGAAPWDPNRPTVDSTGYIFNALLKNMPQANYFGIPAVGGLTPDGLNSATVSWLRGTKGNAGLGTTTGTGDEFDRKQINVKIDHNFSGNHKLSGSYTLERNIAESGQSNYPNGFSGSIDRNPHVLATNFVSTLGANLVNEAKFGLRFNETLGLQAWEVPANQDALQDILGLIQGGPDPGYTRNVGQVYPALFYAGVAGVSSYNFSGANSLYSNTGSHNGNRSILYTFGDTLSWSKGKHAFRFGGELRPTTSRGYSNLAPSLATPSVQGGSGPNASPLASGGTAALPAGALQTVRGNMASLLYTLSGGVDSASTAYWMEASKDVEDGKWQSIVTRPEVYRTVIINEASGFVKDDWKVTRDFTLNLGLRWEYYASPYIDGGFTASPIDRGTGVFGAGRSTTDGLFDSWLAPPTTNAIYLSGYGNTVTAANALGCQQGVAQAGLPVSTCNPALLTTMEFIGPDSPNPSKTAARNDLNNFGPAIGFAWQAPWFGGKTTVRGGYQLTYGGAGRNTSTLPGGIQAILGTAPGSTSVASGQAALASQFPGEYLFIKDIPRIIPGQPNNPALPGGSLPIYSRATTALYGFANDYTTPYTQNFTFSVTSNVRRNMTVDIRYIGTQSKKLDSDINLNLNDVYKNPELYAALEDARQGGNPLLLTQMLAGLNLNAGVSGYGTIGTTVNGVFQTGAMHLRRNTTFNTNLLNGNFLAVANSLNASAAVGTGYVSTTAITGVTPSGRMLRNGCDRIASQGGVTNFVSGANVTPLRCFPENYMSVNPQLTAANYRTNAGSSNYHSMQAQFTLRPTQGFTLQSTWTWSKTLESPGIGNADPLNRRADYHKPYSSVAQDLRTNGTIDLPIGPNKLFFGNSSGWVARAIEGWKTSFILNLSSGRPDSIQALTGLTYASAAPTSGAFTVPNVVGPFDIRKGDMQWDGSKNQGFYFGNPSPLIQVPDPQCAIGALSSDPLNTTTTPSTFNYASSATCALQAIATVVPASTPGAVTLPDSRVVQYLLVNPKPGQQGTLGMATVESPGVFRFDANISKAFRISESKSLQIRVDATNILNHPSPSAPNYDINNVNFGLAATKTGNREFQGSLRLNF